MRSARARAALLLWPRPSRRGSSKLKQVQYRGKHYLLFANEDIGWRILVAGSYEEQELDVLSELIKPTDVCFDIGANIGIYSVTMATAAHQGKVVAFEPNRIVRDVLRVNLNLNHIENVSVESTLVCERTGPTVFYQATDSAYSSVGNTRRGGDVSEIEVQATTLDDYVARTSTRVDVLKIDVEGAEKMVIDGAAGVLADQNTRPRVILAEMNSENFSTCDTSSTQLIAQLTQAGYTPHSFTRSGLKEGWPQKGATENALFLS